MVTTTTSGEAAVAAKLGDAHAAREAQRIHTELIAIGASRAELERREVPLLQQAEAIEAWRHFGCATLLEYVERVLGCQPRTAHDKIRVARALVELPVLCAALDAKQLAYWRVRELTRLATPRTEAAWLAQTQDLDARAFEAFLAQHAKGDEPGKPTKADKIVKVTLELSPDAAEAWFQARTATASELGDRSGTATDSDVMLRLVRLARAAVVACEDAADGSTTSTPGATLTTGEDTARAATHGPAYRTLIATCRDCGKLWQSRAGAELPVSPALAAMAACDSEHLGDVEADTPRRKRKTVSKRMRENVMARDGHRCCVPGCSARRYLDVHHIVFQCLGGRHKASNLITLCSAHHQHLHEGRLTVTGSAPYGLVFTWASSIEQAWRDGYARSLLSVPPDCGTAVAPNVRAELLSRQDPSRRARAIRMHPGQRAGGVSGGRWRGCARRAHARGVLDERWRGCARRA